MGGVNSRLEARKGLLGRSISPVTLAFSLYRKKLRSFIAVYLIIFGLAILETGLNVLSEIPLAGIVLCLPGAIIRIAAMVLPFFLALSLYKPIEEGINGKGISYWKKHIEENIVNGIMIIVFYVCVFVLWAVVWGVILGALAGLFFLTGSAVDALWMALFVGFGVAAVVSYLLAMVLIRFTSFELILGKRRVADKARGVIDSAKRSVAIVKNNFLNVVLYDIVVIILTVISVILLLVPFAILAVAMFAFGAVSAPSPGAAISSILSAVPGLLILIILAGLVAMALVELVWAPVMLISQVILWKLCAERMRVKH
jgi:hypothetical protein